MLNNLRALVAFLVVTVVVCDNNNNNNQVSFRWIEEMERSSVNGIPLFGIKFSSSSSEEEDFAILERSFEDEDCIYRGFLQNEPDVLVSLNGCPFSSTFDVVFESRRSHKTIFRGRDGTVFASAGSRTSSRIEDIAVDIPEEVRKSELFNLNKGGGQQTERNVPPAPSTLVLNIFLAYERSFLARFGPSSSVVMKRVVNLAQNFFYHSSLTTRIRFNVVGEQAYPNVTLTASEPNIDTAASLSGANPMNADAYAYFSSENNTYGVVGIGFVGSVCAPVSFKKYRTTITEYTNDDPTTAETFAHEIGHNLNMQHDFIANATGTYPRYDRLGNICTGVQGIMDYYKLKSKWSTCSVQDLNDLYNYYGPTNFCLAEEKTSSCVLMVGGRNSWNAYLNNAEIVSTKIGSVPQQPPVFPLQYVGEGNQIGTFFNGKPIFCGSKDYVRRMVLKECYTLDSATNTWQQLAPMLRTRIQHSAVIVPNKGFWVTGGIDGGLIQSTTEIYSASGTWTSGPALPKALWGHCVVQLDNSNTLLVGGTENIGGNRNSYIYNWATGTWKTTGNTTSGRYTHLCIQIPDGRVIAAGGYPYPDPSVVMTIEVYDPKTELWSNFPYNLPYYSAGQSLIMLDGLPTLIGGFVGDLTNTEVMHKLTTSGWVKMTSRLTTGRGYAVAIPIPPQGLKGC